MTIAEYLRRKKITPTAAARELGVAPITVFRHLAGQVPSVRMVERYREWSGGKIRPQDHYAIAQ